MIVNHYSSRAAWLAARRETIGSSDAPIIMGLGFRGGAASKSLYELWAEKTGKLEPQQEDSPRLRAGLAMESAAAAELQRLLAPLQVGRHAHHSVWSNGFRAATPDSTVKALPSNESYGWNEMQAMPILGPGELKTVEPIAADDWSESEPSAYALVQLHHQMGVGDWREGWIGAWIGFGTFWHYHIPRNDDLLGEIWEAEERFWQLVQRDIPPEVDASESCKRTLRLLHPKDNGIRIESSSAELRALVEAIEGNKAEIKSRQALLDKYENELREAIGDASEILIRGNARYPEDRLYSWKHQARSGYTVNPSETRVLRALKVK